MPKKLDKAEAIARMKAWTVANYEKGADTMVECWGDEEWSEHWTNCGENYTEAFRILKRVANVFADRQADARYYQDNA